MLSSFRASCGCRKVAVVDVLIRSVENSHAGVGCADSAKRVTTEEEEGDSKQGAGGGYALGWPGDPTDRTHNGNDLLPVPLFLSFSYRRTKIRPTAYTCPDGAQQG